ncbi:MAG: hypothetical protein FWE12_07885 [Oscillospiraceae bacterium]|nr:hypothetical protein [Oscillospiraceae bacterium]
MKKQTIGKIAFWTIYLLLAAGMGALTARFIPGWHGWAILFVALMTLIAVSEWISKKLWPKATCENENAETTEKGSRIKWIIRTAVGMTCGGTFAAGVMMLVFALIRGQEGGFLLPIGLITLSILCLVILSTVRPIQDQATKKEMDTMRKEFKHYHKDERLSVIGDKASAICFWATLMFVLMFGAVLAEFPPQNPNVIPMGLLGLASVVFILYVVLFNLYDSEKLDVTMRESLAADIVGLLLGLVPALALGIRWMVTGLTNMSIAFLAVFLIATGFSVWSMWYTRKHKDS